MSKRFSTARLDKGELTAQGFLKVPATFTRTGVFTYLDKKGGLRRELRHPDDVFHPDSLETLKMAPLTYLHPEVFVDSGNVKDLQTGHIGDGLDVSGGYIAGMVLVTDKKAIAEASKGTVELSCGYTADMIDETGTYNGEMYDCRQTNIRYNHVAQVPAGRAGPMVRMHLDADDAVQVDNPKEFSVKKIKINDKDFEVSQEVADHIDSLRSDADKAKLAKEEEAKALKAKEEEEKKSKKDAADAAALLAEEKKANDILQGKLDLAEAKLKERNDSAMTPDQINGHVKSRMKIEKIGGNVLGAEFKEDASDLDVMKAVIAKKSPSIKLDGKSEDYVKACFDVIADDVGRVQEKHADLNTRFNAPRTDADYDLKAAREQQTKNANEGWKTPLAASKK